MTQRGTTNRNERGSTCNRRACWKWLVNRFQADVYIGPAVPTCRCYRCGALLTDATVTVDRIIPGCEGGTYRRNNIRPSCMDCASATGAFMGHERRARSK